MSGCKDRWHGNRRVTQNRRMLVIVATPTGRKSRRQVSVRVGPARLKAGHWSNWTSPMTAVVGVSSF